MERIKWLESMAKKMNLLWIDLRTESKLECMPIGMDEFFDVRHYAQAENLDAVIKHTDPEAIGFDFDYPSRAGLSFAQELKKANPSIPMLLVTLQHSEKLAIWAFRSRFSDYLVKPVPLGELARCHGMLSDMVEAKHGQRRRHVANTDSPIPTEAASNSRSGGNEFLPAIYYVAQNYESKIQNVEAANLCSMSPFNFSRRFKDAFGITFRDYVVRYRLRIACSLLKNLNASVTEVAFSTGFNDVSYFSRIFKRHFGMTPSEKQAMSEVQANELSATEILKIPDGLIRDRYR